MKPRPCFAFTSIGSVGAALAFRQIGAALVSSLSWGLGPGAKLNNSMAWLLEPQMLKNHRGCPSTSINISAQEVLYENQKTLLPDLTLQRINPGFP